MIWTPFRDGVSDLLSRVKQLKKLPGVDEILVPGERGDRVHERITAAGTLELDDRVWRELNEVAASADNAD